MAEPNVTLTDYFLAAEAALFVVLLLSKRPSQGKLRTWFSLFFASVFVASVCGGTFHGFFLQEASFGRAVLWLTTLLALGVSAFCAWAIGAVLLFSRRTANWILLTAVVQLALYAVAVFAWTQEFWIALLATMPAMLFLMVALIAAYRRDRHGSLLAASGGIAITFVAGAFQHLRIGSHQQYLNHNALAHVIQSVALLLLFFGAYYLVRTGNHDYANTT